MNRFVLIFPALVFGGVGAAQAELLVNPGFEDLDMNGSQGDSWGSFGSAGFNAFFGANGHASLFADQDGNSGGIFQTGITGSAGQEYSFVLTDTLTNVNFNADVIVGLEYYDATDAVKLGEDLTPVIDLSAPVEVFGTAVAGTVFVRPIITFSNSVIDANENNAFVFDASLTAVPEPASLVLVGLGGLALVRRRRCR